MESITTFWKAHPEYWISISNKDKADTHITQRWFPTDLSTLPFLDRILYLDQFMRHFSRVPSTGVTEEDVVLARKQAEQIVIEQKAQLLLLDPVEIVFALMLLKHAGNYEELFAILHKWLNRRGLNDSFANYPAVARFYADTFKKAYSTVKPTLAFTADFYDTASICEYAPPREVWGTGNLPPNGESLLNLLREVDTPPLISLSGGVDSMVMATLAKRAGLNPECIHIVYGNRAVANEEAELLIDYCLKLEIPIWIYRIPWLRRSTADRAFYESMTRTLRFAAYKAAGDRTVMLGHIQEDVVENVWTNLAHAQHVENLAKMTTYSAEDGVRVCRPWLSVKKDCVYEVAKALNIPWLNNTTPSWSNRGKFRERFYAATHAQYGSQVDTKILEVAETLRKQAVMLDTLLYKPVLDSWSQGAIDITPIVSVGGIDAHGWLRILTTIAHERLHTAKPSIHACETLVDRIKKEKPCKIQLKKGLTVAFLQTGGCASLQFTN